MSNILHALIDENRNLVVNPSEGFAGEHNAEIIEIDIGPFADGGYEYYILNFENFGSKGKLISNIIRTENDEPSYISNGVIYCPLTAQLTASGRLRIQLEAHKSTENGEIIRKSSVAELSFRPSVLGEEDMMDSESSVYKRLDAVDERLDGIDAENYGGKISVLNGEVDELQKEADDVAERVSSVENRVSDAEKRIDDSEEDIGKAKNRILDAENRILDAENRIKTVESYDIPETFDDMEKRIVSLEEKPDGIEEIPVAGVNKIGGVKTVVNSPLAVDDSGNLFLRYESLNNYTLSSILALTLIHIPGEIEITAEENTSNAASFIYDSTMSIAMDMLRGLAFVVFEKGVVEYMNEEYLVQEMTVEANHIYVITKEDGVMKVRSYFGNELRQLILEGI